MSNDRGKKKDDPLTDQLAVKNSIKDLEILVVDDDIDSLDILTLILEQEGASVTSVKSGYEALEAFEKSTFDLIVSDIGMPAFDGYSLISKIRKLPQGDNIPAIALSAYAGEVNQQNSMNAGFNLHIVKPVNIAELITAINLLISRS